jgi:hypothetical protein
MAKESTIGNALGQAVKLGMRMAVSEALGIPPVHYTGRMLCVMYGVDYTLLRGRALIAALNAGRGEVGPLDADAAAALREVGL